MPCNARPWSPPNRLRCCLGVDPTPREWRAVASRVPLPPLQGFLAGGRACFEAEWNLLILAMKKMLAHFTNM
jgi:hypothetical protein